METIGIYTNKAKRLERANSTSKIIVACSKNFSLPRRVFFIASSPPPPKTPILPDDCCSSTAGIISAEITIWIIGKIEPSSIMRESYHNRALVQYWGKVFLV